MIFTASVNLRCASHFSSKMYCRNVCLVCEFSEFIKSQILRASHLETSPPVAMPAASEPLTVTPTESDFGYVGPGHNSHLILSGQETNCRSFELNDSVSNNVYLSDTC